MKGFTGLTKRNMMIYFKDIQAVLFSLLTSFIVFILYQLFLKATFVDSISGPMQGLETLISAGDIDTLVNGILLTGIMGCAIITVPYNCLTTIVKDREKKIDFDILATPVKRWQIILSYFVASSLCAIIMVSVILTAGLLTITAMGKTYISTKYVLELYGMIFVGSVSSTAFFMIIVLFFKNSSSAGAFFGILSAAAGFVIGAYIPTSQFSDTVQTVCNLFPASHITVLFRRLLLGGVVNHIDDGIGGIDGGAFAQAIEDAFSFRANLFGRLVDNGVSLIYVGAFAAVCIVVMTQIYARTYKRK